MSFAQEIQKKLSECYIFVDLAWVQNCINFLQSQQKLNPQCDPNFLERVYICFLHTDLNKIGQESLPQNVSHWHNQYLKGYYVLQIDEIINISESLENRFTYHITTIEKKCNILC
jgi:hypothetical protein